MRCFGPQGEAWLSELPDIYNACVQKWQLTNCEVSEIISFNYICFADSPQFGKVALKVGLPHLELTTEMTALGIYMGRNICNCYDQSKELGAMLLERISPGRDLTTEHDSRERIKAAAKLAANLPIPIGDNYDLPSWSKLARSTFGKLRAENTAGDAMLWLVNRAEELITQLENSNRPKVLLHGDLNHWNILMSQDGWKAIDPKGQVGVACMEAGRFMLNELEIAIPKDPTELMDQMTATFSQELGEPRQVIALCAFLDKAIGTSWKFEEHEKRDLTADVEELQFFYSYYENLGDR